MDTKQEIFKRVDALAEKLGVAASYLWHILIKQSIAEGVVDVITAVIGLVMVFVGYKLVRRTWVWGEKDKWAPAPVYSCIGATVMVLAGIVMFSFNIHDGILELINPEYYALTKVLETLSGAGK